MSACVQVEDRDGIRTVRMRRPEKKNALTGNMYAAMADAITAAQSDDGTRCVLIAGVPGAFTAGNDIVDFLTLTERGGGLPAVTLRFLRSLAVATKPLVAAVDGVAVGLGTTLLLHCDQVVASERSVFRAPFVDLGLVPEAASSLLAPRVMGLQRAFALLCLGEPFDARRAEAAGFVSRVVPPDEVEPRARAVATAIAAKSPAALALARRLMRGDPADIVRRIDEEAACFGERLATAEVKANLTRFLTRT